MVTILKYSTEMFQNLVWLGEYSMECNVNWANPFVTCSSFKLESYLINYVLVILIIGEV